jgi:23S rRNA maturation mini-RNase III
MMQANSQKKEIKMAKRVRMNSAVSPKQRKQVEREAYRMDTSMSAIVRMAINEYFERKK